MSRAARAASQPTRARTPQPPEWTQPPPRKGPAAWVVANPIPAVTLAGLVLYGLFRFMLQRFYGDFGVEVEDVGLTYADVLSRTIVGALALLLAGPLYVMLVVAANKVLLGRTFGNRWVVFFTIASGIAAAISLYVTAQRLSDDVQSGQPVRPGWLNPLGLRVEGVTAKWIGADRPTEISEGGTPLLLLGRANGVAVLYNPTTDTTLRLPDSQLLITHR